MPRFERTLKIETPLGAGGKGVSGALETVCQREKKKQAGRETASVTALPEALEESPDDRSCSFLSQGPPLFRAAGFTPSRSLASFLSEGKRKVRSSEP